MSVLSRFSFVVIAAAALLPPSAANACGGLFCQNVPVDQAGEQILFHQDGEYITAMVRILYEGESENFSWVVPVPDTPELSTGSDAFFDELEQLSRPQFILETKGSSCPIDFADAGSTDGGDLSLGTSAEGDVVVEQSLSVGPFAIEIVSSTNPDEMASWLEQNDYDLSDRGRELIAPYVEAGMKFVAVKLRSGQSTGSIQPLVMKYKSSKPMVPIRLTAVAALEDMGILVWLVSDARAVPDNYLHVQPNYTRLNWYRGTRNAYASYQSLITDAMDEAGGQGFATDFAGPITETITGFMTSPEDLKALTFLSQSELPSEERLQALYTDTRTPEGLLDRFPVLLPLPQEFSERVYTNAEDMASLFSREQLNSAIDELVLAYNDVAVEPLETSFKLIPQGQYLTRLYTTLSADEMTVDPSFEFNPTMPEQSLERHATLELVCGNEGTQWWLTLGEGTGRQGERVISANAVEPLAVPSAAQSQSPVYTAARTFGNADPLVEVINQFAELRVNGGAQIEGDSKDNGFLGGMSIWWLMLGLSLWVGRCSHRIVNNGKSTHSLKGCIKRCRNRSNG